MIRERRVFFLILGTLVIASCKDLHPFHSDTPGYYRREARIKNELAGLGEHPWVGKYTSPTGLTGSIFYLAPRNGWAHFRWACTADSGNHGQLQMEGDRLVFAKASGEPLTAEELEQEILRPLKLAVDIHRLMSEAGWGSVQHADRIERLLKVLRERNGRNVSEQILSLAPYYRF